MFEVEKFPAAKLNPYPVALGPCRVCPLAFKPMTRRNARRICGYIRMRIELDSLYVARTLRTFCHTLDRQPAAIARCRRTLEFAGISVHSASSTLTNLPVERANILDKIRRPGRFWFDRRIFAK